MTRPRPVVAALAAAFCALAARPLPAQAAAEAGLATAVAAVLEDSIVGRSDSSPIVWDYSASPLDVAVARALGSHRAFRGPIPDPHYTMHMGIHQVTHSADTVGVVVEFGSNERVEGPLTHWSERRAYFFVREASSAGWRFVRSQFIRHADGGAVRG